MSDNKIHTVNMQKNNVVYVSNSNVKQLEKQAEAYSKQAEKYALECENYLKTIQRILTACEGVKSELAVSFDETLDRIEAQFAQDISDEVDDINSTVSYLRNVLVELVYRRFEEDEWIQNDNNDYYSLVIDTPVVFGIYDEDKNLVFNINTQTLDNSTVKLTALAPFSGYVCVSTASVSAEDEDNNEFSEEELIELEVNDWDVM